MPIIATDNGGTSYSPAPAGTHQAVCVDVHDEGVHRSEWQGRVKELHKVSVHWQIDEPRDDGKRFVVRKWYTLSLHEKANLRADLESWRGKAFTEEELKGFDPENLLGANCLLSIVHEAKNGRTYANIKSVMALPRGMPKLEAEDYVRLQDREPAPTEQGAPEYGDAPLPESPGWPDEDDLPF